ncbi:MAG: ribosome recycling factor, partial [Allorhizobium sp.]
MRMRDGCCASALLRSRALLPVAASSKGAATPEPPAGAAAAAAAAAATAVELLDLRDVESRMQRSLQRLKSDLSTVSAARADPRMFDSVTVDAYGSSTPLGSVAQVSAKSANMLHVSVFDPTVRAGTAARAPSAPPMPMWCVQLVQAVRQAIVEQDLGLNPVSDGN